MRIGLAAVKAADNPKPRRPVETVLSYKSLRIVIKAIEIQSL